MLKVKAMINKQQGKSILQDKESKVVKVEYDIQKEQYYLLKQNGTKMKSNKRGNYQTCFKPYFSGVVNYKQRLAQAQKNIVHLYHQPSLKFQRFYQNPTSTKLIGYAQFPHLLSKELPAFFSGERMKTTIDPSQCNFNTLLKSAVKQGKRKSNLRKIIECNKQKKIKESLTKLLEVQIQKDYTYCQDFNLSSSTKTTAKMRANASTSSFKQENKKFRQNKQNDDKKHTQTFDNQTQNSEKRPNTTIQNYRKLLIKEQQEQAFIFNLRK